MIKTQEINELYTNSETIRIYKELFKDRIHCAKHKKEKNNKPICNDENECKEMAFYTNDKTNYPQRCEDHKEEGDFLEEKCKNCKLLYILNSETNLYTTMYKLEKRKISKLKI